MKKLLLLGILSFFLIGCSNQYQKENDGLKTQIQELQKKLEQQSATTTPQQPKVQQPKQNQPKPPQPKSSLQPLSQEKPKEIDGVSKTTNCFAFADTKTAEESVRSQATMENEVAVARIAAEKNWEETRILDREWQIQDAENDVRQKHEDYLAGFQQKKFAECLYLQKDIL